MFEHRTTLTKEDICYFAIGGGGTVVSRLQFTLVSTVSTEWRTFAPDEVCSLVNMETLVRAQEQAK